MSENQSVLELDCGRAFESLYQPIQHAAIGLLLDECTLFFLCFFFYVSCGWLGTATRHLDLFLTLQYAGYLFLLLI